MIEGRQVTPNGAEDDSLARDTDDGALLPSVPPEDRNLHMSQHSGPAFQHGHGG